MDMKEKSQRLAQELGQNLRDIKMFTRAERKEFLKHLHDKFDDALPALQELAEDMGTKPYTGETTLEEEPEAEGQENPKGNLPK